MKVATMRNLDEEKSAMRRTVVFYRGLALVLPATLFIALAASLTAQESKPAAAPTPAVSHRVPSYFGQVELTAEQRAKIYAIQDVQQPTIDRLKDQIEAARAKLLADSEAVLTASQRERLTSLRAAAKAKSLARTQARAKARQSSEASAAKKAG
jgi:Spy/CpxP family protein refolding chaperone